MSQQRALMAEGASGGQQVDHEPVVSLWPMVAKRWTMNQGCALMASGVPSWPMVANKLTMSQQRALMAKEGNGGQQVDHEPVECPCGQWWPLG